MPPTKQEIYLKELQNFCWDNGFNPEPMRNERLAFFAQAIDRWLQDGAREFFDEKQWANRRGGVGTHAARVRT